MDLNPREDDLNLSDEHRRTLWKSDAVSEHSRSVLYDLYEFSKGPTHLDYRRRRSPMLSFLEAAAPVVAPSLPLEDLVRLVNDDWIAMDRADRYLQDPMALAPYSAHPYGRPEQALLRTLVFEQHRFPPQWLRSAYAEIARRNGGDSMLMFIDLEMLSPVTA